MSTTTDFGYREVRRADKAALVRDVFDSVAGRYDLMNDLMSFGLHRAWKAAFVAAIGASRREALLDLAGGTGDIAFAALRHGAGRVILSDINAAMLGVAQARALDRGLVGGLAGGLAGRHLGERLGSLSLVCADAEAVPLPDRCVEKVSIAFGLRNCTDKAAVLREARRVLRPGGRFHCLEFSRVDLAPLAPLYDAWSFRALPAIGARVAGDADSYRYLAESIRRFPDQETLAGMFREAGFGRVAWRSMAGGIVAIHSGWRL